MANIIDFEDLKQDAGDLRNLQDDDLSGLSKLIQKQLDLDSEIENMEETIKEMKERKRFTFSRNNSYKNAGTRY